MFFLSVGSKKQPLWVLFFFLRRRSNLFGSSSSSLGEEGGMRVRKATDPLYSFKNIYFLEYLLPSFIK